MGDWERHIALKVSKEFAGTPIVLTLRVEGSTSLRIAEAHEEATGKDVTREVKALFPAATKSPMARRLARSRR